MQFLEPWRSVEELPQHLGISKETVYWWLERKKISTHGVGKQWRFKPSEIDGRVCQEGASQDNFSEGHENV